MPNYKEVKIIYDASKDEKFMILKRNKEENHVNGNGFHKVGVTYTEKGLYNKLYALLEKGYNIIFDNSIPKDFKFKKRVKIKGSETREVKIPLEERLSEIKEDLEKKLQ